MKKRIRMARGCRRSQIIAAGCTYVRAHGFLNMTRKKIAVSIDCAPSLISLYFSPFSGLTDAVIEFGIANQDLTIIARGLMIDNAVALGASEELKIKAWTSKII